VRGEGRVLGFGGGKGRVRESERNKVMGKGGNFRVVGFLREEGCEVKIRVGGRKTKGGKEREK